MKCLFIEKSSWPPSQIYDLEVLYEGLLNLEMIKMDLLYLDLEYLRPLGRFFFLRISQGLNSLTFCYSLSHRLTEI